MPKKKISYVLALLLVCASFLSWLSVDRAIVVEDASNFIYPAVIFSVFAVLAGLFFVVVKENLFSLAILVFSFAGSLFFSPNTYHLAAVAVSVVFAWTARKFIRDDMGNCVKISVSKSLGVGFYELVIALALVISSQYFFSISNVKAVELVPKFESNKMTSEVISYALKKINPEFDEIKDESLTLDKFLSDAYEMMLNEQQEDAMKKIEEKQKEMGDFSGTNEDTRIIFGEIPEETKDTVIASWKEDISSNIGYGVSGDEKAVDIMIALINSKTMRLADSIGNGHGVNKIAFIFAVALLLTLVPLGAFFSRIWVHFCWAIFMLLRKIGAVDVQKVPVDAERIV